MSVDFNIINPYIRRAMPSILSAGNCIVRRIIFDYELIFIESGNFTLNYAEKDYYCKAGDFIFLRPGVPHSFSNIITDLSQPHIHFDMVYSQNSEETPISFKDYPDLTPKERLLIQKNLFESYPPTPLITFKEKTRVLELFYRIVNDRTAPPLFKKAILTEIINMIITDNFPDCFSVSQREKHTVSQHIKNFIDANQGITLSLDDFEKQFCYSKYYMERQFKKTYGVSLISYRNAKKMELAKKLLLTESVSSVAEQLGFSSIYSFSRAYKNHFGICPSGREK